MAGLTLVIALDLAAELLANYFLPGVFDWQGRAKGSAATAALIIWKMALSAFAGYVSARLGGRAPLQVALILACTLLAVTLATAVSRWGEEAGWFRTLTLLLIFPATVGGGYMAQKGRTKTERPL